MAMTNSAFARIQVNLYSRSVLFVAPLEDKVRSLLLGWIVVVTLACLTRTMFPVVPGGGTASWLLLVVPHGLIMASPFLAYWAANAAFPRGVDFAQPEIRSEEHTSELQSLMRISYAVFCLKKKKIYP